MSYIVLKSLLATNNGETEEEEVIENSTEVEDNNYLYSSGIPCRPTEEPIVDCLQLNDCIKKPKAVAEAIDLDVRRVLIKLASGGHHDQQEEEETDVED